MAMPADAFNTYETVGLREDLGNLISMLSPVDNQFYNSLSEGGAKNVKVDWQVDALAAIGSNAAIEGADETIDAVTATTKVSNYTQIQKKSFALSGTNASTNMVRAGRVSEKDYQTAKKGKELSRDIERAFLQGLLAATVAGSDTVARGMKGILAWVTTNLSKAADATLAASGDVTGGTARDFTSAILLACLQDIYTNGGNPSLMYTTPTLKTKVSAWAQATSNYRVAVENAKLEGTVDVYASDFGLITIKPHRDMKAATALILDPARKGKKGTLRNLHREQLANTGDNEKWVMRIEHTLRDVEEAGLGRITNLQ